jgi:mono/diheme cytochrome c family protein
MTPQCLCILLASSLALINCSAVDTSRTSTVVQSSQPQAAGDIARGGTLYSAHCASCHGATGREGGFGPSLAHENRKMDSAFQIAWIENPNPPMFRLYPIFLTKRQVADIAAYVESL